MTDAIGWLSSAILLVTVSNQVLMQWRRRADQSASRWLFSGQFVASLGFTSYSVLLKNWVFTVTNAMLCAAALAGFFITISQSVKKPERGVDRSGAPQLRSKRLGE